MLTRAALVSAPAQLFMDSFLPPGLTELRTKMDGLVATDILPHAARTDNEALWPAHAFAALKREKLMGLHVPRSSGGLEEGLLALTVLTESMAKGCPSAAICYGMHCVGTAVIAAKATAEQTERFLKPIAAGEHVTTLSLSEFGSGVSLYLPQTRLSREKDHYMINGTKQFVTNGSRADSYVVTTLASDVERETGDFSCLIVENNAPGMEWLAPWDGFGMRGNSSRGLRLTDVRMPVGNLLGEEGDQVWYVFEVIAPYFLMAMAGTYLGVAQAALDETMRHLKSRTHSTTGDSLAAIDAIQPAFAELWARVERTRLWIYHAAQLGDIGHAQALPFLMGAKVEAADTAVHVTNEAMSLCGGIAYRENSTLSRLLRDARAGHVMSPTTAMLKQWIGRALLGQPML